MTVAWAMIFEPAPTGRFCGKLVSRRGLMTRKYSLVIEGDSSGYSAYVPELPAILVTGHSVEELTERAKEAIQIYWESLSLDISPTSTLREIEVELSA
jgi:predicted RNase H-like HicB family nuclease